MSFAADVKNELCKAEHSRKQLELLSKGAAYAMTEDGEGCFFNTENKRVADSIADAFDSVGKEYSTGESTFRGRTLYTVTLADKSYAYPMPDCSGDDAFGVYLRGIFLVCGLVANPEKGYQLELFLHDESKCRTLLSMIEEHGMGAKLSSRRGSSFLYIKESEKISDMLTYMGAMMQAMEIMNVKIYKEVRTMSTEASTARRLTLTRLSPPHRSRRTILITYSKKEEKGICPTSFCRWQKSALPHLSCRSAI